MRIITEGPAGLLGAAIMPVRAHDAGAWQGRGLIHGTPGTQGVPAPLPGAVPQSWNRALHRSSDAPPVIYPSLYYLYGPQAATPDVSWVSDNQMPIPAKDPRGTPAVMSIRPTFLGQRQVTQPSPTVRFPNIRARNG